VYLQRFGGIDPDWEWNCSIRRKVTAVLQPYYHVLQDRRSQAKQTTLPSYFKKRSEEPPADKKTADDDPVNPDNPQPGHSSRQ
jgi:hypothetical protein